MQIPRLLTAILLTASLLRMEAHGGTFSFQRDPLAFANDTLRVYSYDAQGVQHAARRDKTPEYSRHCLVMVRAVIQFHRFASFDPGKPRASDEEYRRLVKKICRIPACFDERPNRIVIPGFADLRSFSKEKAGLLQDEIGLWWPTYWRVGNWQMGWFFPRTWQAQLAEELVNAIDRGELPALFITRFRPLNHAVIPFRYKRLTKGDIRFDVYDPNNTTNAVRLTYDASTRSFILEKTGYWNGGRVNAFRIYHSLIQ